MNFLAHIYLSGNDKGIQVGNFIGDYVKGSSYLSYPDKLRWGILLHRAIDDFTDRHELVAEAKQLVRPYFGRYSGIFIDMYYDHFLATDWGVFSSATLSTFARKFYVAMVARYFQLPHRVRGFLPYLIGSNRLCSYVRLDGLRRSFEIMESYSSLPKKNGEAIEVLQNNYDELSRNFHDFFPLLIDFSKEKLEEIRHYKVD